jgi:iron-sulfur cluster assembly protein
LKFCGIRLNGFCFAVAFAGLSLVTDHWFQMIHVTEKAAQKIRELLAKEGVPADSGGLRVGVQGGGCSGLSYAMRLETQARDRDNVIEENGARVFVDPKSFLYLSDTTLDFEETLVRQGFVFQNPQATRSCGCGSSFTA